MNPSHSGVRRRAEKSLHKFNNQNLIVFENKNKEQKIVKKTLTKTVEIKEKLEIKIYFKYLSINFCF